MAFALGGGPTPNDASAAVVVSWSRCGAADEGDGGGVETAEAEVGKEAVCSAVAMAREKGGERERAAKEKDESRKEEGERVCLQGQERFFSKGDKSRASGAPLFIYMMSALEERECE
jgi:hypothetical protein